MSNVSLVRNRWIDALLLVGGVACLVAGWAVPGIALLVVGAVAPLVRWTGRRRGAADVYDLVPESLSERHAAVVAAAELDGVVEPAAVVDAADDVLLETAALLVGRPPRGRAQWRLVEARVRALADVVAELEERHQAWVEARRELDEMAPPPAVETAPTERSGVPLRMLVAVLLPFFLTWDALAFAGRMALALVEGVAIRLRATGRVALRAGRVFTGAAAAARRSWTELRSTFATAARDARRVATAAGLRVRLRLRAARRLS